MARGSPKLNELSIIVKKDQGSPFFFDQNNSLIQGKKFNRAYTFRHSDIKKQQHHIRYNLYPQDFILHDNQVSRYLV